MAARGAFARVGTRRFARHLGGLHPGDQDRSAHGQARRVRDRTRSQLGRHRSAERRKRWHSRHRPELFEAHFCHFCHQTTCFDLCVPRAPEELSLSVLEPINYPERFEALGLPLPAGILLYGPPGCGKTLLAKAVANESGTNFISVKVRRLMGQFGAWGRIRPS